MPDDPPHVHEWGPPYRIDRAPQQPVEIQTCIDDAGLCEILQVSFGNGPKKLAVIAAVEGSESLKDAVKRVALEVALERERADKAEDRCKLLARGLDARDREIRTLAAALTEYGDPPWWLRAAHAFDSLDRLANSAQIEP